MQTKHGFNLFTVLILLMLAGAGCVQPASEEVAPTEIGARATFTPTLTPTDIPPPTETPTEIEADALAEGTATPTETPTPTATATATPTATATATPTATEAESALIAQGPTEIAQDDAPTLDPNLQQPPAQEGVSESQLTATAIIAGATETQAFILTATAAGLGIGIPTASPTPTTATGDGGGLAPATVVPTNAPGADCLHEVKAQDRSLYRLSLAYGVPINSIAAASGIVNPDLIRVGQILTIPGCGTTGAVPPPTSTPNPNAPVGGPSTGTGFFPPNPTGDCTWGTSVVFPNGCPNGTTTGSTGTTGNTAASPGTTTGTGGPGIPAGSRTHVVAQGETLFEISLTYGVAMDVIASANGITNYDQIRFNQVLIIP